MVRERAASAGLTIDCDLPPDLPIIEADSRAMTQIVLNVLSNAVKFTPEGGRIEISARPVGNDRLRLKIADNGQGMAAVDIPRALKPFTQLENPLNKTIEGTGLGLPLVKALVELHHGNLEIHSTPGDGTTVVIDIPCLYEGAEQHDITPEDAPASVAA